jgi:hypothetical protein
MNNKLPRPTMKEREVTPSVKLTHSTLKHLQWCQKTCNPHQERRGSNPPKNLATSFSEPNPPRAPDRLPMPTSRVLTHHIHRPRYPKNRPTSNPTPKKPKITLQERELDSSQLRDGETNGLTCLQRRSISSRLPLWLSQAPRKRLRKWVFTEPKQGFPQLESLLSYTVSVLALLVKALPATVANPLMSIPINQFETRGSSWKMAAISSPNWSILRFRRSCTMCGNWNYQNQHSELQNLKRKQQQVSEEVGTIVS